MKSFGRTGRAHGAQPGSWVAELIELAALFLAVGVAHLFLSLVAHHADGSAILIISGVALVLGAVIHRWWGVRSRRRGLPRLRDLVETAGEDRRIWQVRATLRDRPGSLAALSGKLAALDVNILAIQAHPMKDGVADELLVAAPQDVTVREIAAAVDAGGGVGIAIAAADPHDLVDQPTRALDLAVRAASDPRHLPDVLGELLRADAVREPGSGNRSTADGTTIRLRDHAGAPLILSRPGLPFIPAELARAQALVDLCARLGPRTVDRC